MKIVSFAATVETFLTGKPHPKTVTRREWKDHYASKFHVGDVCKAYDKSPRNGGKQIGLIRILKKPYRQNLKDMTKEDLLKEGGRWDTLEDFEELFNIEDPYVVEFEKIPWTPKTQQTFDVEEDLDMERELEQVLK
jgi:hypothetical protein